MALRMAATSGVGFRYLPRKGITAAGLFGSAGQAANQLLALLTERPSIRRVKVYGRDPENRRNFARKYSQKFDVEIVPFSSPEEVVVGVDIVHCATNTSLPLFDGNLLEPGQHVTGTIGSDVQLVRSGYRSSRRREIDDRTAERADLIVCNLRESILIEEPGDLYGSIEKGLIRLEDVRELGELGTEACPGPHEGRPDHLSQEYKRQRGRRSRNFHAGLRISLPNPADLPRAL